jgi:F0F1-type ATP synthase delta subunit
MRYSLKNYAEALAAAVHDAGPSQKDAIIRNFLGILGKSGDEAHAEKIVSAAEKILRKKDGGREIVFESARPLKRSNQNPLLEIAKEKDTITQRINLGLIAGVRIIVDGEREFDGSLKGKLDKMFANI